MSTMVRALSIVVLMLSSCAPSELPDEAGSGDLVIHPVSPPEPATIGSIAIAGPLQTKALAQLNRGYNLANWLEAQRFDGFDYDEAFVEKVAAAGYRALRLPIDLDLYVTETSGSGDELTLTLHDDLFTVLDTFDTWTAAHGLSLTIDYHQYDASLDLTDDSSVDEVAALWRAVAAHFAANPRDDIYYELMNEPEQSTGAPGRLAAAPWSAAATRILTAIRGEDALHTVIFGDVGWYGIDALTARAPFDDDNVVYAFHFYEPFIFTHQGASWTGMTATHGVPYPYDSTRWSEYSSDFGLDTSQPQWVWDQFRNYHSLGTRAALRNSIVRAKAWGVSHGVPVLCNEFGAYGGTSLREDRLRYYTDVVSVFAELEIPWQEWFGLLGSNDSLPDDYRQALQLDP